MTQLIFNLFTGICSILGLYLTWIATQFNNSTSAVSGAILALLIIFCVYCIVMHCKSLPKSYKESEDKKLQEYMRKQMTPTGRILINTRDLSWVDEETMKVLKEKCTREELEILAPKSIGKIKHLQDAGARVYEYSKDKEFALRNRFTIKNRGTADEIVLLGREKDGKRQIWRHKNHTEQHGLVMDTVSAIILASSK